RVHGDGGEVPRADADVGVAVDQGPLVAAVVGAVQAALLGLDQGVDTPGVAGGDGQADASPGAAGQALAGERLPGVAAAVVAVQAANGAAADQLPRPAPRLPQGG